MVIAKFDYFKKYPTQIASREKMFELDWDGC